jgi:hypothetical protein
MKTVGHGVGGKYTHEVDYLRSYVHILRRKLEANPQQPRLIISKPVWGTCWRRNPIRIRAEPMGQDIPYNSLNQPRNSLTESLT